MHKVKVNKTMVNLTSTSQPLQIFLSNLIAEKAAAGQQPLLVQDNARCHVDQEFQNSFQKLAGTPCNSTHKRQGAARWNDSFEVIEHHQSPSKNLLISPNSVMALDRLVSPKRRESLVANSAGYSQLRKCQHESKSIKGNTAAFLASLPMDDGNDECR